MHNINQRFTKWYYDKGYRMEYKTCDYGDGVAELVFYCPWWVRLLANLFFSPSTYYHEASEDIIRDLVERAEVNVYV